MKKKLHIFLTGFIVFSLISHSVVFANTPSRFQSSSANYCLEYRYDFINSTKYPINKILVKGLMLLDDTSEYYSLVSQNVDGKIEDEEYMSYFTKEIENIKPQTVTQIIHQYELQLSPVNSQIDSNKIQPLKSKEGFDKYLNPESYIDSDYPLIKETAEMLVGDENNPYIKAKLLYEFVATKMKYNLDSPIKNTGSINAIEDIKKAEVNEQQGGVCYDYATLYTALLRSQGIPARVISGFKVSPYDLADLEKRNQINIIYNLHSWVEFYIEPYGWTFADPTIDIYHDGNDIFQNFTKSNNLYIKKGYNLPFDILEYTIDSVHKADVKVRQSAILKKNVSEIPIEEENNEYDQDAPTEYPEPVTEENAKNETDNSNNPIPNHEIKEKAFPKSTESNEPKPINVNNIIEYRRESVYKILDYQKAKKELKNINYNKQSGTKDSINKNIEIKDDNSSKSSLQTQTENKPNFFQRIISFFIKLFNKFVRGENYGVY